MLLTAQWKENSRHSPWVRSWPKVMISNKGVTGDYVIREGRGVTPSSQISTQPDDDFGCDNQGAPCVGGIHLYVLIHSKEGEKRKRRKSEEGRKKQLRKPQQQSLRAAVTCASLWQGASSCHNDPNQKPISVGRMVPGPCLPISGYKHTQCEGLE